jgi:two-component system response regulator HupR/HoxA
VTLEGILSHDFQVIVAEDAEAAEAALQSDDTDVVLTDYDMPGRNGLELVKTVEQSFPATMVLLLTGHPEISELKRAEEEHHVVRVLAKPYDPKRLVQWVANAVQLSRLRRSTNALARITKGHR